MIRPAVPAGAAAPGRFPGAPGRWVRRLSAIFSLALSLWSCGAILAEEDRSPVPPVPDRPILMVHGAMGFGGAFDGFKSWLERNGTRRGWVSAPDFPWTDCMDDFARAVGREVKKLRDRTGRDRVILICHSLGCGAVLSYLNLHGGAPYVSDVVTVAGDNHGAYPRPWGLISCATRDMTPYNSEYVRRMFRGGETRPGIRYCALQAGLDWVLHPDTTALEGAKTVRIPFAGHGDIIHHEGTFRVVARDCLAE